MYVCNLERREKDEILLMQREGSYGTRVEGLVSSFIPLTLLEFICDDEKEEKKKQQQQEKKIDS